MKSTLNINEIWSSQAQVHSRVMEDAVFTLVKSKINGPAHVYAVMDHAVAFGRYDNGEIKVAIAEPDQHTGKLEQLPISYVRELRIFQADIELRAVRSGDSFCWRLRQDFKTAIPDRPKGYILDELHKLWGAVSKSKIQEEKEHLPGWSMLTSRRGSAILVPGTYETQAEVGLKIRNYIDFRPASEGNGIIHFMDERLLGFETWPGDQRREGNKKW